MKSEYLLHYFENLGITKFVITVVLLPILAALILVIKRFIKDTAIYVFEGIAYFLGRALRAPIAAKLTLKHYARLVLENENNKFLHVPSSLDISLDIDQVFVTLSLELSGSERKTYTHENMLNVGNRIRVIGDPGSGKTSLIKRLVRDTCRTALERPSKAKFPVIVELRTLEIPKTIKEKELGNWFYEKIRSESEKYSVYKMEDCFQSFATSSGLLIFLDGLDEVATKDFARVQKAIEGLSKKLAQISQNNVVVLTMRTQFYYQIKDVYRDGFGNVLFLKPFTPSDIFEFLSRWKFTRNAQHEISRIFKELTDHPSLREMCSNPLILSMYVAEDQRTEHIIAPASRTEFYGKVSEELIVKRRFKQTGPVPAHQKLREQRERILGGLAYEHLLNLAEPANSLSWSTALKITRRVMQCSEEEAASAFREIAKETGLVTEEQPSQTIRFIHLTLCEFLAAFEAIHGQVNGWKHLIDAHKQFQRKQEPYVRSRLIEVIPFACSLLYRSKKPDAINDVAALGDNGLLARCFLETKLYDHDSWPLFVASQSEILLAREKPDEKWLYDLHLFNMVIMDSKQCAVYIPNKAATSFDSDNFFQKLTRAHNGNLSALLSAYASQDAAAVFRLAEMSNLNLPQDFPEIIIDHCDQVPFFTLVLDQALEDEERIGMWSALLTEAGLRSRVVSDSMIKMPIKLKWQAYVEKVPKKQRWIGNGFFKACFYTQCLTIALGLNRKRDGYLRLLNISAKLFPPSSFRAEQICSRLFLSLTILNIILSLSLKLPKGNYIHDLTSAERLLPAYVFVFLVLLWIEVLAIRSFLVIGIYRYILNLNSSCLKPFEKTCYRIFSPVSFFGEKHLYYNPDIRNNNKFKLNNWLDFARQYVFYGRNINKMLQKFDQEDKNILRLARDKVQ